MFTTILEALNNLVQAIQTLSVSAQSAATANATGCGCPGGADGPLDEGIEGETPPEGYDDTDDPVGSAGYQTRKCVVANIVHKWVKDTIDKLDNVGVGSIANALLTGGFSLAVAYLLSVLTGLVFGWVFVVIGFAVAVISSLIDGAVNLTTLSSQLVANDDDFVCGLYSSQSSGEARSNYLAAADAAGVSTANKAVLAALFSVDDILNTLFFSPLSSRGAELEAAIAAWSGGVVCSSACAEFWADCSYGTVLDVTDTTIEIEGVASGADYLLYIGLDVADNLSVTQTGWTLPSEASYFSTAWDTAVNRCGAGGGSPWTNIYGTFVNPAGALCHGVVYRSNTPFTVTYTRS